MTTHKIAKNREEAWALQDQREGLPHGWIQWKGTDVCMDVHCKCGAHTHVDDSSTYYIKCPACGTTYFCNGHIEFIEVEDIGGSRVVVSEMEED
jgi:hypothetical protein